MAGEVTAVVPTLGTSPWLAETLGSLRRDGGAGLEIVVIDQRSDPGGGTGPPAGLADRVVRTGRNLGFAGGVNRGLAETASDLVAVVNDDLVVEPGWLGALVAALAAEPRAAAAQGINLRLDDPKRVDGTGLAWNRSWQAVQRGHGGPAPPAAGPAQEVFGVSGTAALYRRRALAAAALPAGEIFDSRLVSYYEDVDLAVRLRAAGWTALVVPRARARHAGSATGEGLGARRLALLYGNRHLVLARLLGRGYWRRLPRAAWRDVKDLLWAAATADSRALAGIPAGWARAGRHLPAYAHRGAPMIALEELERFREPRPRVEASSAPTRDGAPPAGGNR